jgi:signal transduction histidine kinase
VAEGALLEGDLRAAYDRHSLDRERATFATASLLVCTLVPAWTAFDFYLEPELAPRFLLLRLVDLAVTLALWRMILRSSDLHANRRAMAGSVLAVGLVIVAMLGQIGPGHYALYTLGLSLVFWGVGLLLLWPLPYTLATFGTILVAHGLAYTVAAAAGRRVPLAEFVGLLFYLGSAAAISAAQLAVRRRVELDAFRASFVLQARNVQLASAVAALDATQARLVASSAALAESLDVAAIAERVTAIAVPGFASWAVLVGTGPHEGAVRAAKHVDAEQAARLQEALAAPAPSGQYATEQHERGVVERIVDATAEDLARLLGRTVSDVVETRSLIVAPLVARGQRSGTLVLGRVERNYEPNEVAFAEEIARRAALALDNARLFQEMQDAVNEEQRARDVADAASRTKDEFLASVSHELRTPLSAILGWSKMLSLPLDPAKRQRAVETIERNAVVMAQLIEDLLDVSRIVSGKLRLELRTVQLSGVVEAAIESVRPAAEARSVRIEQALEPDAGAIHGDPARLQQVVCNLLCNAVKFTLPGGRVSVTLAPRGTHAEIVVRDTGKGIDPRFLPHVFEAFRQAEPAVTRSTAGLGLGLAIVKHLVELHGGRVEASSDGADRGAAFTVRLPLLARRESWPALQPDPGCGRADASLATPPKLVGLRVLVVEDEDDMRQLLEDVLTACGSRVTATGSVAEAMGVFERGDVPDVLISDIGMPGETGYDLIRRVRGLPPDRGGNVPAAALTAYTRAEDRRRVLGAGYELHVPKPIEPAEVVTVVATLAGFAERS